MRKMVKPYPTRICPVLIASIIGTLLLVTLLPALVQAAPPALPPRPTLQPTLQPTSQPTPQSVPHSVPVGSLIDLRFQFPETGLDFQWQELWTVVQWLEGKEDWHNVEGWQGTPDEVNNSEGKKVWWVAKRSFGKGPFRWLIYRSRGGDLLATSDSFYLPDSADSEVWVEVSLECISRLSAQRVGQAVELRGPLLP